MFNYVAPPNTMVFGVICVYFHSIAQVHGHHKVFLPTATDHLGFAAPEV